MGDALDYDPQSRVNTFLHVNHEPETRPRYGTLMCVNGTGILNRWLHDAIGGPKGLSYQQMNEEAAAAPGWERGSMTPPKTPSRNWTLSDTITPRPKQADAYAAAYNRWRRILPHQLNAPSDHD